MVALVDEKGRGLRLQLAALHRLVGRIVEHRRVVGEDDPVAFLEIGQRIGERRQRQGVGAKIHRPRLVALPVADGERRPLTGADQQVGLAVEEERQRERAPSGEAGLRRRRRRARDRSPSPR